MGYARASDAQLSTTTCVGWVEGHGNTIGVGSDTGGGAGEGKSVPKLPADFNHVRVYMCAFMRMAASKS